MKQNRLLVILITGLLLFGAVHAVSANNTASFSPESPLVYIGDTTEISIVFDEIAPEGFAGCEFNITLSNPDAAVLIEDVTYPEWATNHLNVLHGDDDLFISVCDGANEIQPGNTNVTLVTFSLKGIAEGSTDISIVNPNFDNMPLGNNIEMTLNSASTSVTERVPDIIVDAAGSGDYTTITDAVDNANANAWILVKPGVYSEAVVISENLKISSSDGAADTIVDAGGKSGFLVYNDGVEISGFTIRNAEPALYLRSADCIITGCTLTDNTQGIRLRGAEKCRIYQNDFINNTKNVVVSTAGLSNTWHSPDMVSYSYEAQNYCNYLGNYWGSSGADSNGDGLLDDPMVIEDGVNEDNYALAKLTTAYSGELPDLPVAGFSVDDPTGERYAGRVPLTVQFTDTSTGVIDSYAWDFGADGTIDSIERNPVWICEIPGLYTVNLTVTNRAGSDTYSWSNCIRATITSGPDIQSVHCYGGNETDRFTAGCPAGDGGHIFIGETYSVESGDVTTNHGSRDYWVVKTDANENLEWQRCYGGTGYDYGYAICTANDGGYLIGGRTKSTDCEVTDNHGGYDAWMVKIDAAGVPEWKKCYGGTNTDEVKDVLQTTDGGYLMVGDSKSTDGDLTGIPTEGGYDSWVIKTDESGTIEWQERYGGSKNDYLVSGLETGDGNYVLCGYSQSYNGDLTLNHGNYDCWIMQINSTGGLQWQKSFGGKSSDKADCLIQTTDGGYLMGGFTKSSDGDVTGYHGGYSEDGWLVKTDSDGVLEWQKCYGGTDKEFIRALRERPDGGYIIAGDSESDDGDLEGYFNYYQGSEIYVIGISSTGDIEWQKLIGGHLNDRSYVFCTKDNGDYLIGGRSSSRNRDMYLANAHGDGDGCVVVLEGAGVPFAAQFEADVTTGAAPLTVQFTDLSTGEDITAWAWDFDNDGTTDSIEENPVYTYDTAGVYSVSLTVTNVSGTSTETKADYITVDAGVLRLDFDPLTSTVVCGESTEYAVVLESVPTGLSGYNLTVSLSDDTVGEITGIDMPAWASLSSNGTLPASSVWIKTSDLNKEIQPGAVNVPMGTITVTGLATGVADLPLAVARMDDDDGLALTPETGTAAFSVNQLPAQVADFRANVTSGTDPLMVQFTDLSTGEDITAWAWDFDNDGTTDSTEENPAYTYDTAGVYTVNLTVTNSGGTSTETKADYITVDAVILHLDFDPLTSAVGRGESTVYSITLDSAPTGLSGYNLTVSLSDDTVGEITAVDLPAWASLSSNGTLPASSVWIKASDLNKEIQPGAVNVPMGTITVTGLATGVADLSLAIARMDDDNGFALNPETGTAAFSVNQLPAPVADFRADVTSGTDPLMVQFTDLSTGEDITAWAWDFDNDGTTDSTEENPAYTYDTAGVYTVNLTVTNKGGSSTETKADYITVDAVILHLDFDPVLSEVDQGESATYAITLDTVPDGLSGYNLTVSLSDDTVGEIIAVDLPAWASLSSNGTLPASSVWIKATDLNKEIQQGAENVPMGTVTVTGLAPGAADLSLDVARIDNDDGFALNPETGTAAFSVDMPAPVADFNAYVTSGTCPLAVQFTDLSAGEDITAWAWDFNNDGTIDSTEQNPVHTYTNIGLFTVTLEVSNTGGADVLTRSRYITVRDVPPVPPESSEDFTFDNNGTTFTDIGDQQQVSFNSSVCNGTVDGDNILLRNGKMNVTISTYGLSTIGDVSTGNVSSVLLESSPVNAPLGREVGNVSVGFNATMNNYNPDLGITTSIFDQPSAEASKVFTLAAADEKLSITSTAYAVYFTKTNLTEENGLRNAFLEMTVSPKWVKTNGGIGAIRVFRQGDDGVTQILDTTYLGINADGMMVFKAFSPDGFSSFAVAATAASATPVSVGDDSDDSSELSAASAGNLKAGETKTLSISNSPVTQIGLEMQSAVSSLLVTVTDERNSPAGAPVPDCDVWRYLSFALYHANPSAISDAVITFEVPEEVVGEKTAVLMWLNGNEWKELTTTSVGTEGNNRLFSAEIPEFSWFAIGITDVGTSSGEIPTEVITPTMTPSTEPTGTPVDITPVTPTTTATSPEDTVPPTQTPLSIAGVLFGAAGAGVLFRKIR